MTRYTAEVNRIAYEKLEALYDVNEDFQLFIDDFGYEDCNNWENFTYNGYNKGREEIAFTVHNGASRGVLIFDDFDWVIKFNFLDEADLRYNFCEGEVSLYKQAVKDGMQKYFAETWKAGEFHGRTFYVMRRAETCETNDNVCTDMNSGIYDSDPDYICCDRVVGDMTEEDEANIVNFFGNYYEKKEILGLLDYCGKVGIFDIYDGNVGYIDEDPVFIDYAGY